MLSSIEKLVEDWNEGKITARKYLVKIWDLIQDFKNSWELGYDECYEESNSETYEPKLYWDSEAAKFRCKTNPKHLESFGQATREFCNDPECRFSEVVNILLIK